MPSHQGSDAGSGSGPGSPPLGWTVASVGAQVSTGFRAVLPGGVHPRQYAVLQALSESAPRAGDGMSQRALADGLGIPQSRLVQLLDDLEARGWAERAGHPTDRRVRLVRLTAQGRQATEAMTTAASDYERRLTADLDDGERATLRDLLRRLHVPGPDRPPSIW